MDQPETCSFANRAYPAVRGAPVEALSVVAKKDRTLLVFPDGEVDGSGGAGHERDEGGLVALADDASTSGPPRYWGSLTSFLLW